MDAGGCSTTRGRSRKRDRKTMSARHFLLNNDDNQNKEKKNVEYSNPKVKAWNVLRSTAYRQLKE